MLKACIISEFRGVENIGILQASKPAAGHIAEEKFSQMPETDRIAHVMKVLPQSFESTT